MCSDADAGHATASSATSRYCNDSHGRRVHRHLATARHSASRANDEPRRRRWHGRTVAAAGRHRGPVLCGLGAADARRRWQESSSPSCRLLLLSRTKGRSAPLNCAVTCHVKTGTDYTGRTVKSLPSYRVRTETKVFFRVKVVFIVLVIHCSYRVKLRVWSRFVGPDSVLTGNRLTVSM